MINAAKITQYIYVTLYSITCARIFLLLLLLLHICRGLHFTAVDLTQNSVKITIVSSSLKLLIIVGFTEEFFLIKRKLLKKKREKHQKRQI